MIMSSVVIQVFLSGGVRGDVNPRAAQVDGQAAVW